VAEVRQPLSDQTPTSQSLGQTPSPVIELPNRNNPALRVRLKKYDWFKGGFDTVMLGHFTIQNANPFDVKDISIHCEVSGNSGTVLGTTSATIYDVVPANKTRTFRDVNLGFVRNQAAQAWCKLTDVKAY
jgi:hypothetical protein